MRSLVETSGPAPSRKLFMPMLITGTVASLALIAGIITTQIEEPRTVKFVQSPITASNLKAVSPERPAQSVKVVSVKKHTANDDVSIDSDMTVAVVSVETNDLAAMNIDPTAIFQLQRSVAGADSIGQCGGGSKVNSTICVWHNGKRQELSFSRGDGPMPVMFTSSDGKGQMVRTSSGCSTVDANKLIPFEARSGDGNVVMWFAPTDDIVRLLPDNIAGMIQNIEVHMVFNDEMDIDTSSSDPKKLEEMINNIRLHNTQQLLDASKQQLGNVQLQVVNMKIDSIIRSAKQQIENNSFVFSSYPKELSDSSIANAQVCAKTVQNRIIVINQNTNGKKIPCVGVDGARLQESRLSAGALRMEGIYPNPTSNGSATVSYTLSEDRQVTFALYDLAGNKVASTQSGGSRTNGKGQISFALNNATPGMYLVTLTTDKGEKAVQRLIVQ
ncbi:MAG: T9SS type A sorting domain-containing protein [Candidatus Kapabacteria bacterium]|nr:T9SS type A sorting domain-containing protein [Candidatus Kapabacteria bacterium]